MGGKRKPPEPSPTFAVPEKPPSSDPERVILRIGGISYSIPACQAATFRARLTSQSNLDARAENLLTPTGASFVSRHPPNHPSPPPVST
jgi:hypothetical protein